MKDFTKRQRLLIRLCLLKHMLERHLEWKPRSKRPARPSFRGFCVGAKNSRAD